MTPWLVVLLIACAVTLASLAVVVFVAHRALDRCMPADIPAVLTALSTVISALRRSSTGSCPGDGEVAGQQNQQSQPQPQIEEVGVGGRRR